MSAPTKIDQCFRRNVRGELLRLLNHQRRTYISREEVERIGNDCGLSSGQATYEFLSLTGVIWEGTTSRASDSQHPTAGRFIQLTASGQCQKDLRSGNPPRPSS